MSGVALVPGKSQLSDSNGNPLAGGTVDVYLAGTTTRTNSWQDQALTSLNTNPIVLDGSGSCSMWLDGSTLYKIVVKNAVGATQSHLGGDNISGASGSASFMTFLQAGTGAVSRNAQTKMRENFSVQDFMTDDEISDANNPSGPTNNKHSAAFAACFAAAQTAGANRIWVPPVLGAYSVRDVTVPPGFTVTGAARKPFDPADYTGVLGMGSVILRATGGTSLFKWTGGNLADGLVMHGIDKTVDCFVSATGARLTSMRIMGCGLYGWRYAIGNPQYLQTLRAFYCNISDNFTGIYSLIDSMVAMCYISYNDSRGVDQEAGANDTCFFGNRVEWNGAENFAFNQCVHNSIEGGNIDRSGLAGISVFESQVRINPSYIQRSGKDNLGGNACAHIHLNGASCDVSVGPIITTTGVNDDLTGDLTPNYGISVGGAVAPARLVMVGGSLTGNVTAAINAGLEPVDFKIVGVAGAEDRVNGGLAQRSSGRRYFARSSLMTLAAGATSAAVTVALPSLSTNSVSSIKVRVEARNANNNSAIFAEAIVSIQRQGAGASMYFVQAPFQATSDAVGTVTPGTTLVGPTAGETIQLAFSNVAVDASSFDVTAKNNHATNTYQVRLTVTQ